jgi:CRP/FNR family cyclic AMP-dependent transcriptional regulator
MDECHGCFDEFGWLAGLSENDRAAVGLRGSCRPVPRGVIIFSPEEKPGSVFLLREGLVRIFRVSKRGDELTLGYIGPQEVFGELSGFCGFPRESHAMAMTPCRVCELPQTIFHGLLDRYGDVALDVVAMISRRMKRLEARLADVVFRDSYARLCAILLELAEDFGRPESGGILITIPLTQAEIASLIGSVRQTVNPLLRRLEESKLIARRSGHFIVLDRTELRQLATSFS